MVKVWCGLGATFLWAAVAGLAGEDSVHARSAVWQPMLPLLSHLHGGMHPSLPSPSSHAPMTKKTTKHSHNRTSMMSLEDKASHVIEFVRKQMQANGFPGMGISVVYQHKTAIVQGLGTTAVNSSLPVLPSTQFAIGGLSHTLLALAVAKLTESHELEWNDPISMYLPWFSLMDEYAASHTTVGDLLSHNSVINMMDGTMAVTFAVHATDRPLVEALRHLHTTHEFRSGYSPTSLNSIILGQVVEAVTNQTWHAYILDAVATPLHMDDTKGRPEDAPPGQLTSGHLFCNGTVIGPFSLANSSMMSLGPQGAYVAGSSMVASLNDVTKLSLALLPRHKHDHSKQGANQRGDSGGLLFQSPKTLAEMTTGQSFNSLMTNVGPWLGLSYSPSGNSLAAGYGFDTVGDVMHGEHFFGVLGVAGYVPSHGLGVVLMSNAEAAVGGLFSAQLVIPLVHSYILGVYLDIPIATLENEFANAIAAIDHRAPVLPCDPHYFENKPWDVPGVVIPDKTKRQLVGTYNSTESVFYGGVAVYIDHEAKDKDLVLQYGEYARRLIATGNDGVYIWALEARGATFVVQFVDKDARAVQLHFFGKSFVRK